MFEASAAGTDQPPVGPIHSTGGQREPMPLTPEMRRGVDQIRDYL